MGKLVENLKKMGYEFQEGNPVVTLSSGAGSVEVKELRVASREGQIMILRRDETPLLFPGDTDGIPQNDRTGEDGIRTTTGQVYRDYYELDDESYCQLLHNYSLRTKRYLDAERERIGLVSIKESSPEAFFVLDEYDVGRGVGRMDVGRYADGRFVAQSRANSLFEGMDVLRMHFTHLPDKEDIEDALVIRKMDLDLRHGRHREVFICSDCKEMRHWLDIPGSIQEKIALRLKRKCGCARQEA